MADYRVVWEIDIWAHSSHQAAEIAQSIQRDPESLATVFKVMKIAPECSAPETVDLMLTMEERK